MKYLIILLLSLLVSACTTTPAIVTKKSDERQMCQAYCTYRERTGAVRRIHLTSVNSKARSAWEMIEDQCVEIQSIAFKRFLKRIGEIKCFLRVWS